MSTSPERSMAMLSSSSGPRYGNAELFGGFTIYDNARHYGKCGNGSCYEDHSDEAFGGGSSHSGKTRGIGAYKSGF